MNLINFKKTKRSFYLRCLSSSALIFLTIGASNAQPLSEEDVRSFIQARRGRKAPESPLSTAVVAINELADTLNSPTASLKKKQYALDMGNAILLGRGIPMARRPATAKERSIMKSFTEAMAQATKGQRQSFSSQGWRDPADALLQRHYQALDKIAEDASQTAPDALDHWATFSDIDRAVSGIKDAEKQGAEKQAAEKQAEAKRLLCSFSKEKDFTERLQDLQPNSFSEKFTTNTTVIDSWDTFKKLFAPAITFSLDDIRKLAKLDGFVGNLLTEKRPASMSTEKWTDLNDIYNSVLKPFIDRFCRKEAPTSNKDIRETYSTNFVGPHKAGKTLIGNILIKSTQIPSNFTSEQKDDALRKIIQDCLEDHLIHTTRVGFYPSANDRSVQYFMLDSIGLGSAAIQAIDSDKSEKTNATDRAFLEELCQSAREMERFQSIFLNNLVSGKTGTKVFVIEQYDDQKSAMIKSVLPSGARAIVLHNLRNSNPADMQTYLNNLRKKYTTVKGKGFSYLSEDILPGKTEEGSLRHFVLGPLDKEYPGAQIDGLSLSAYNLTIFKGLLSASMTNLGNPNALSSIIKAAAQAAEEVDGSGTPYMKQNASLSNGYTVMQSKVDGTDVFTVALPGFDPSTAPSIQYEMDYKNDIACTVIFNDPMSPEKKAVAEMILPLPKDLKPFASQIINILKGTHELLPGSVKFTLPKRADLSTSSSIKSPPQKLFPLNLSTTPVPASLEQTVKMDVPISLQELFTKGITVEGDLSSTTPMTTVAVEGAYNAGKTFLIRELLGLKDAGVEGDMVHTEGVTGFVGTVGSKKVQILDTMGKGSGELQSESADASNEAVRKQQNAIAGAVAPNAVDATLFVTNSFDNITIQQLLAGKYDLAKTIVVHNLKYLKSGETTGVYIQRIQSFLERMGEQVTEKGLQEKFNKDGLFVYRQPSGLTHVFFKNQKVDSEGNKKVINYLRQAIGQMQPKTSKTLSQSVYDSIESMIRQAFVIPDDATIQIKSDGKTYKPSVVLKSGTILDPTTLVEREVRQETFATGFKTQPLKKKIEKHEGEVSICDLITGCVKKVTKPKLKITVEAPFAQYINGDLEQSIKITREGIEDVIRYKIPATAVDSISNLPDGISIIDKGDGMLEVSIRLGNFNKSEQFDLNQTVEFELKGGFIMADGQLWPF